MYTELHPVTYYFYPLLNNERTNSEELDSDVNLFRNEFSLVSANKKPALLYIHIPYCHDICQFCPFHIRVDNDESVYKEYTNYLCKEMSLLSQQKYIKNKEFSAVYFGGGSPSIFPPVMLQQIFESMHKHFNILPGAEISFEGEPRTLGDGKRLDVLKQFEVKRISFGLQTYDPEIRKLFKIKASLTDVENVRKNSREWAFDEVNVDMMYDLPGQTPDSLRRDLDRLCSDNFDSVDYYNLHYFSFPKKIKLGMRNGTLPSKPNQATHMKLAQEVTDHMVSSGYNHVADQVFSRNEEVCEYFKLLWGGGNGQHDSETIAVGTSARGYINGVSYLNRTSNRDYYRLLDVNILPIHKVSNRLNTRENRGAAFFLKFFQLEKKYQNAITSISPELLRDWIANGYLKESDLSYELTPKGKLWIPNMTVDLLESEQRNIALSSTELLSKRDGTRTGTF